MVDVVVVFMFIISTNRCLFNCLTRGEYAYDRIRDGNDRRKWIWLRTLSCWYPLLSGGSDLLCDGAGAMLVLNLTALMALYATPSLKQGFHLDDACS